MPLRALVRSYRYRTARLPSGSSNPATGGSSSMSSTRRWDRKSSWKLSPRVTPPGQRYTCGFAAIDERAIGFAVDAGAHGVIAPDVRAVDDAQRPPPPAGTRRAVVGRSGPSADRCHRQLASCSSPESVDAITVAQSIALVDGIDAVMAGPGDLALDAGLKPRGRHPPPQDARLLRPGSCRNRR